MLLFAGECNSYSSAGFIEGEADAKGDGRCFLEEVAWGWVFLRFDIWMDSPKGKGMLEPLTDLVVSAKFMSRNSVFSRGLMRQNGGTALSTVNLERPKMYRNARARTTNNSTKFEVYGYFKIICSRPRMPIIFKRVDP